MEGGNLQLPFHARYRHGGQAVPQHHRPAAPVGAPGASKGKGSVQAAREVLPGRSRQEGLQAIQGHLAGGQGRLAVHGEGHPTACDEQPAPLGHLQATPDLQPMLCVAKRNHAAESSGDVGLLRRPVTGPCPDAKAGGPAGVQPQLHGQWPFPSSSHDPEAAIGVAMPVGNEVFQLEGDHPAALQEAGQQVHRHVQPAGFKVAVVLPTGQDAAGAQTKARWPEPLVIAKPQGTTQRLAVSFL